MRVYDLSNVRRDPTEYAQSEAERRLEHGGIQGVDVFGALDLSESIDQLGVANLDDIDVAMRFLEFLAPTDAQRLRESGGVSIDSVSSLLKKRKNMVETALHAYFHSGIGVGTYGRFAPYFVENIAEIDVMNGEGSRHLLAGFSSWVTAEEFSVLNLAVNPNARPVAVDLSDCPPPVKASTSEGDILSTQFDDRVFKTVQAESLLHELEACPLELGRPEDKQLALGQFFKEVQRILVEDGSLVITEYNLLWALGKHADFCCRGCAEAEGNLGGDQEIEEIAAIAESNGLELVNYSEKLPALSQYDVLDIMGGISDRSPEETLRRFSGEDSLEPLHATEHFGFHFRLLS